MGSHGNRKKDVPPAPPQEGWEQWRERFTRFDPAQAVEAFGLRREGDLVYVPYWGRNYRLRLTDGVLEKEREDGTYTEQLERNEALVLYHTLGDLQEGARLSGKWVPEDELQAKAGGGKQVDWKRAAAMVAAGYQGRLPQFNERCKALGGVPTNRGDAGWEIRPLPWLPVRLLFWAEDEEFPANLQVLVDSHVTMYLELAAVECLVWDVLSEVGKG